MIRKVVQKIVNTKSWFIFSVLTSFFPQLNFNLQFL